MLCDDVQTVDSHMNDCPVQEAIDSWARIKNALAEITTIRHYLEDDVKGYGTNVNYPYLIERLRQLSVF